MAKQPGQKVNKFNYYFSVLWKYTVISPSLFFRLFSLNLLTRGRGCHKTILNGIQYHNTVFILQLFGSKIANARCAEVSMEQTRFEDAPIMSIHRRITAGTFMGQLSDGYTLGIVGIALSYAQGPLGLTSFWMGILAAASYAGILFGCLFAGMICDRIGRRPLYSSVMFFLIAFAVSQFFISDPILLATVRFFLGLLVGTDYTAGVALLSEWAPEKKRPTILAWLLLFWALGYCIAYLVGFVMDGLGENGWRWVICTSAVPAAITQIIRFGLPESPQWLVAVGKQDRAQEIISRFMGERYLVPQEQEKVESASWFSLFSARQWRKTVVSCAVWCCQTLPFFAISIFIPLVLEKLHVDNPHASGALYNIFTMAGVFIGTWIFVNVSRRAFLMWTFYVPAALLVLLILWKDMPPMMAIAVISAFALVLAMSIVAEYSYPPELFPTELRASGVGLTIASSRIGVSLATFLLPVISEHFGIYATLWSYAVTLIVGGVICQMWAPETSLKHRKKESSVMEGQTQA